MKQGKTRRNQRWTGADWRTKQTNVICALSSEGVREKPHILLIRPKKHGTESTQQAGGGQRQSRPAPVPWECKGGRLREGTVTHANNIVSTLRSKSVAVESPALFSMLRQSIMRQRRVTGQSIKQGVQPRGWAKAASFSWAHEREPEHTSPLQWATVYPSVTHCTRSNRRRSRVPHGAASAHDSLVRTRESKETPR